MNKRKVFIMLTSLALAHFAGCKSAEGGTGVVSVTPSASVTTLESGFSAVRYDGDFGFDEFLAAGGAARDADVAEFLAGALLGGMRAGPDMTGAFGCSTIAVSNEHGESLFGRNFDWGRCNALIVACYPGTGYASLSTVNTDFVTRGAGGALSSALGIDRVMTLAALYAPLDGFNEAGVAVSVNMIEDTVSIDQDTGLPDLTTTTAVRLILNKASSTDDAVALLRGYDMHSSMGMMVHFAVSDRSGKSVAIEYVNNEMVVTETAVLTNFYVAPGAKYGVGTAQSHERFEILTERLVSTPVMSEDDVRDALNRVSKHNFSTPETTEWSAVINLNTLTARYFHRENYDKAYDFALDIGGTK